MPRFGSIPPAGRFFLALMITAAPISLGVGCSSKPAEVDTALVSPDPAVRPAPAPEVTSPPAPTPGADGATTPSTSTTSPSSPSQGAPTKP